MIRYFYGKESNFFFEGGAETLEEAIQKAKSLGVPATIIKRTYVRGDQEDEVVWSGGEAL